MSKQTQTQTTKPQRAPRASKPVAQAAQEQTPAQDAQQAPAPTPAPVLVAYLAEGFRPDHGLHLYAHTMAFLELSGMLQGKSIPGATLRKSIGSTAIRYHRGAARLVESAEGWALTETGRAYFAARRCSAELKAAYMELLSTGQPNDKTIKNPAYIHKF